MPLYLNRHSNVNIFVAFGCEQVSNESKSTLATLKIACLHLEASAIEIDRRHRSPLRPVISNTLNCNIFGVLCVCV